MITKNDFKDNIKKILSIGIIESKPLTQIDILKELFRDDNLTDLFFMNFTKNYPIEYGLDELFMKTQDFVYRLHYAISEWLLSIHGITDIDDIKLVLNDLINNNIDFYSAVSYDEFDKEIIEEYETIFPSKDI